MCRKIWGSFWKQYDTQFRSRHAVMPASWSALNHDLWLRCMSHRDATANSACRQRPGSSRYLDFNKSFCRHCSPCRFEHSCLTCGAKHPLTSCPQSRVSNNNFAPTNDQPCSFGFEVSRFRGQQRNFPIRSRPFQKPGRGGFRN